MLGVGRRAKGFQPLNGWLCPERPLEWLDGLEHDFDGDQVRDVTDGCAPER